VPECVACHCWYTLEFDGANWGKTHGALCTTENGGWLMVVEGEGGFKVKVQTFGVI